MLVSTLASQDIPSIVQACNRFWRTSEGQQLRQVERACIGPLCEQQFGQAGIELGFDTLLTDMTLLKRMYQWAPSLDSAKSAQSVVASLNALPFCDDFSKLTVIHHLLDFVENPSEVLHEACRITADDGLLVVIGWRPYRMVRLLSQQLPAVSHNGLRANTLKSWLHKLDFGVMRHDYCGFNWLTKEATNERLENFGRRYNLPLSQVYVLVASRKSMPITPMKFKPSTRQVAIRKHSVGFARERPLHKRDSTT